MDCLCKEPVDAAWFGAGEPKEELSIIDWAEKHIQLPLGGYAIPGPFHVEKSLHLKPIFEALQDDTRRMVNVQKATQTGGTLVSDIYVPWTLDNWPGPIMWNWHTDPIAKQHAEVRAMPVIRGVNRLARLWPDDRHASRKNEVVFKNGVPLYIQGPAAGNLQGKSIRYLINDECWQWIPGRLREALARVTQYKKNGTSKVLNISQGGEVGDDWHKLCSEGDFFQWEVPCPHCGAHQVLKMEEADPKEDGKKIYRMKWDKDGGNIWYECEHCLKPILDGDATKAAFNSGGRYRQTRVGKDRETVTFQWNSLIWLPWAGLVKEYRACLEAKKAGALHPLKAFVQKEMADFWNEKDYVSTANVQLRYLDYDPKEKWADEKFREMMVDCQAHLLDFWVVISAWGANQRRRLWRGNVKSWEEIRQLQLDWGVRSQFVLVDSGYRSGEVYRQCCRHVDETGRGWVAMRGSASEFFIHTFAGWVPERKSEKRVYSEKQTADTMMGFKNLDAEKWLATVSPHALELYRKGKLKCPLYHWSNPSVKDIASNLRDGKAVAWVQPEKEKSEPMEAIYRAHLASEPKIKEVDSRGVEVWKYHQVGENHLWDCICMETVGAIMGGVLPIPGQPA